MEFRPGSLFSSDERSKLLFDWASTEFLEFCSLNWMFGEWFCSMELLPALLVPIDVATRLCVPVRLPYRLWEETRPSLVIVRLTAAILERSAILEHC